MNDSVSPARSLERAVDVLALLAAVSLVLALFGFLSPAWLKAPLTVRFLTGVMVFGVAPGLLMVGPFQSGRGQRLTASDLAVSVVTCSFSCNLALNAVLFVVESSLYDLTRAYVVVQLAGYALWAGWMFLKRRRGVVAEPVGRRAPGGGHRTAVWLAIGTAIAVVVYITYAAGSPPSNSEELVWLRKLVENPIVRYNNLSYRDGDPSTYLFVPFQILIGGASIVAHADVALIYSLFWAVTTALSIFLIARLAFVIAGRHEVAALACVWMVVIAIFEPSTVVVGSGIVAPYPNRYGFAGGVLLPLILLLFWAVLREPRVQLWRWVLLIYVTVEMTFVHARETLLALGIITGVLVILLARAREQVWQILRIAAVIGVTAIVLVVYKKVNLYLAADLDAYVGAMTTASRSALADLLAKNGPTTVLTAAVPSAATVTVEGSAPITLTFATYQRMFLDTWGYRYLGRLFLPTVLLLLPIFAWSAKSVAEMSLAVVLAALGYITSSGLLTLTISALVGNPEVLIVYNVIALFSLLIIAVGAWRAGVALAGLRYSRVAAGACVALVIASFVFVDGAIALRTYLFSQWGNTFALLLIAATVLAVVLRVRRTDLPLFAPSEPAPRLAGLIAFCLVLTLTGPAVRRSDAWSVNPLSPPYPASRFSGDLVADYPLLSTSGRLDPTPYPIGLIRFLRDQVAPNQTLLAGDALALLERVPHFTAILSNKGDVAPHYIVNGPYLRDYSRSGSKFHLAPFFADDAGVESFARMLGEYHIGIVIVDPDEAGVVTSARERSPRARDLLQTIYEEDGFAVFRVVGATPPVTP